MRKKSLKKNIYIYIFITESLCCTPETQRCKPTTVKSPKKSNITMNIM